MLKNSLNKLAKQPLDRSMNWGRTTNKSRGQFCEQLVADYFSHQLKYIFVTNNLDLYFGEIDLLFLSPEGELALVEVKSVNEDLAWRRPVAKSQLQRLSRVFEQLSRTAVRPVRMHLAAVNQLNEVTVFYDFLGDETL